MAGFAQAIDPNFSPGAFLDNFGTASGTSRKPNGTMVHGRLSALVRADEPITSGLPVIHSERRSGRAMRRWVLRRDKALRRSELATCAREIFRNGLLIGCALPVPLAT